MRKISTSIAENILGNIRYRNNVVTGEIAVDNGNRTYNVYISGSDIAYPNIHTTVPNPAFSVGDGVELLIEYGSKEMPIIIGYSQKVIQDFIEDEVDYSGMARVETLDAYSIIFTSAYLEGRIYLSGGAGNCTRRGFQYGTTTDYGSDTHTDGSYGSSSYAIQATGLIDNTTYHFRAYIIDENGDTIYGGDKTFTTIRLTNVLISCDLITCIIYIHSGISSTILDSFAISATALTGLAFDGNNLISCDQTNPINNWGKIRKHSGISSTIIDSFNAPHFNTQGITFDGNNLISCDDYIDDIYIHSGITSTITDSWNCRYYPRSLTFDGVNLISGFDTSFGVTHPIYIHSGVTSTTTTSFTNPGGSPTGLAYDGTNLISCTSTKIYIHSGVTSTIIISFDAPNTSLRGLVFID